MADFDPLQRVETWLFQQTNGGKGKPVYRRLPYNLVSYDGLPARVLEPRNATEYADLVGNCTVFDNQTQVRIGGIEYVTTRPYPMFAIDDLNAAAIAVW
jgi:hypothetical protein